MFSEKDGAEILSLNCGLNGFKQRYDRNINDNGNVFENAEEFNENNWECKRSFIRSNPKCKDQFEMLCCPEDVLQCKGNHQSHEVCNKCYIPLCRQCCFFLRQVYFCRRTVRAQKRILVKRSLNSCKTTTKRGLPKVYQNHHM